MKKFIIFFISMLLYSFGFANEEHKTLDKPLSKLHAGDLIRPNRPKEMPLIPLVPSLPNEAENIDNEGNIRNLEKNYTVMIEAKVKIFIPLEIVSDINVDATVYGEQTVEIPFEVELNKEPEKKDYYKLKYSETDIDIDGDGKKDTYIYSPEFINAKYVRDNYVEIQGAKITREGDYKKKIYVTVEAGI